VDWVTQELARLLIALQIMAVGVTVPGVFALERWKDLLIFLFPITITMWLVSATIIKYCLSIFSWPEALIIGACLAPTDPVLANAVVKGKFAHRYIPTHLQHLLSLESAANDGLGLPMLMLPTLILTSKSTSDALENWAIHTWLYEILLALIIGAGIGALARFLLRQSEKRHWIDKESFLVFSIALTLLVTGIVAILGADDFLAVFAAGNAFAWDAKFLEKTQESHFSEVLDMLFNISFFIFFGATIPWTMFSELNLTRMVIASALILLLRRLPIVMALQKWTPILRNRREAFFAGWFGPMGVGAIFFSIMTRKRFGGDALIGKLCPVVVIFVVLSSIIVHGITVPMTNFHMKKRARRKAKRKNKLRAQLETIADCASEENTREGGSGNGEERRASVGKRVNEDGGQVASREIIASASIPMATSSTTMNEGEDESVLSDYTHYTASSDGETNSPSADIEMGTSPTESSVRVVKRRASGRKHKPKPSLQ
jgi:NhaP-type Na+/H+ or K+/H+ antiporter